MLRLCPSPVGRATTAIALAVTSSVLGAPASLIGSELSSLLGSDLRSASPLCRKATPARNFTEWGSAQPTLPLPPPCWYQSTPPP